MNGQTADGFKRYHPADTWILGIRVFLFALNLQMQGFFVAGRRSLAQTHGIHSGAERIYPNVSCPALK
jgi:hypothetical protein